MGWLDDIFLGDDEKQVLSNWRQQRQNIQRAIQISQVADQHASQRDYLKAAQSYVEAIKLNAADWRYWNGYAYNMFCASQANVAVINQEVLDAAHRAVLIEDGYITRWTRGCVLLQLGRLPEALLEWSWSLRYKPDNTQVQHLVWSVLSRVFVSYSFTPSDKDLAEGLSTWLAQHNFITITGEGFQVGSVPQKIKQRVGQSFFLIAILTLRKQQQDNSYTTSNWLIAEASSARTFNRQVVLMVEQGISRDEYSCVLGDEKYISFNRNSYTTQVAKLILALNTLRRQIYSDILEGKYSLL